MARYINDDDCSWKVTAKIIVEHFVAVLNSGTVTKYRLGTSCVDIVMKDWCFSPLEDN